MKLLRAFWRGITAPEYELWWGGYFLCRFLWLVKDYSHSGRTAWDIAYVAIIGIAAAICTYRGFRFVSRGRA